MSGLCRYKEKGSLPASVRRRSSVPPRWEFSHRLTRELAVSSGEKDTRLFDLDASKGSACPRAGPSRVITFPTGLTRQVSLREHYQHQRNPQRIAVRDMARRYHLHHSRSTSTTDRGSDSTWASCASARQQQEPTIERHVEAPQARNEYLTMASQEKCYYQVWASQQASVFPHRRWHQHTHHQHNDWRD